MESVNRILREQGSYKQVDEDRGKGYQVLQKRDTPDDAPIVLTKITFDNVSPDKFKEMFQNWQTVQKQMQDNIISLDKIGEEDGNEVLLQKLNVPFPLTNRYFINIFYKLFDFEGEQDHHILLVSSEGTDSYVRDRNLEEVHAFTHLTAYLVWPVKD